MFRLTFARKITFSILMIALFVSFLYTSITIVREQSAMTETIVNEKMGLSEFLAKTLEVAEATAGIAYRHRLIEEISAYEDVVYVRIIKPSGEIYLSTNREEMGKFIKDPAIYTEKTIVKDDVFNGENIKVAISPTTSDYTLWLGFSLKELQRALYESLFLNLLVFLPVFIIIILASFFISRGMIRPVRALAEGVESIGKGNLNYHIKVKGKDEIGELASAFNKMTQDLKQSQEQIRRHAQELEQKVAERTKELDTKVEELTSTKTAVLNMMEDMDEANKVLIRTQDELKDSLEELKEMDIKKDQFISIAAHELKTPLTSIHGFSQLLQNRKVANNFTKRNKYLKIMDHETRRLAKLVGDILDLSRIDLGTVKVSSEEIDLKGLIEDLKKEMGVQIEKKKLESEYDVEKGLPSIKTDREKLTEILINLINNAVKYTPKGKITVNVFREGGNVHFVVKDTGIGISKENQEKVFERFYQVDSSYTRKAGGTGLGLALCKEFIDIMGGSIWVESEEGRGSEFHFTLPIKRVSRAFVREGERRAREVLKRSEETREKIKKSGLGSPKGD